MRVFLLAITILLLVNRIKSTPRMLSKTIYFADLSKAFDDYGKKVEDKDRDFIALTQATTVLIFLLFQLFMIVYYLLVGIRFSSNTIMLILTALQIATVFITCRKQLNKYAFSQNMSEHKFYRFYFLFNVLLDYVYYPMTINLLLRY